jgi:hypothetical protein
MRLLSHSAVNAESTTTPEMLEVRLVPDLPIISVTAAQRSTRLSSCYHAKKYASENTQNPNVPRNIAANHLFLFKFFA